VAGAGNEDEDVDFVRSFPAGINLPNVVTVGAVDVALQPASFTSYGKSIDLYANGFEVPSKVPGGMPINISGTSLAAPQVTNLAGKILAINPRLTAAQVRAIIEETATEEGPRKLKVINPVAALERVRRS
jgi:subtilisin family serine protease